MSIKDQIRQEIERRKKVYLTKNGFPKGTLGGIKIETYEGLLFFIDSLQAEEPSKDLEEEISRTYHDGSVTDTDNIDHVSYENIAHHFAEWGRKAMRDQMMKEAVEGEVCGRVHDHINVRFADGVSKYLEPKNISHIPADVSKYAVGDKVKIIILPSND